MTPWPGAKAKRVLAALEKIGWVEKLCSPDRRVT
jgi:hypothetical protein